MRRLPLVAALLSAAVPLAASTASAAPPDSDAAGDDALASFESFAEEQGVDIHSPTCTESDEALTFVCYALTADGTPFVAEASLADDVVEWEVLSGPPTDSSDGPESSPPPPNGPDASEPDASEPDASEPEESATDEPAAGEFDTLVFFDGVFSADPDETEAAIELTRPGSPAEAYARFQHLFVTVAEEYDTDIDAGAVFLTADSVRVCVRPSECSEITDIEVRDGQIVSFAVDGNGIGSRLATTGEPVVVATTAFRLAVAYQTVTGDQLAVYLEMASEQGDMIDVASAVYVGADGAETPVALDRSLGFDTSKLKGNQTAYLAFPGAAPGGEIHVTVFPADGSDPVVAIIPVEALEP